MTNSFTPPGSAHVVLLGGPAGCSRLVQIVWGFVRGSRGAWYTPALRRLSCNGAGFTGGCQKPIVQLCRFSLQSKPLCMCTGCGALFMVDEHRFQDRIRVPSNMHIVPRRWKKTIQCLEIVLTIQYTQSYDNPTQPNHPTTIDVYDIRIMYYSRCRGVVV